LEAGRFAIGLHHSNAASYQEGTMERKTGAARAPRIRVPGGSALCISSGQSAQVEVLDASTSGMCFAGSPIWTPDSELSVVAWWPGIGEIESSVRLVRTDAERELFAVEFLKPDPIVHLLIKELTNVQRFRAASPAVLIYGREPRFFQRTRDAVLAIGLRPIIAHSPLEALWPLQDCRERVTAVMVDASLGGLQLAGILADEFPDVPRILATDRPLSSTRELCAAGIVGAVLDLGASPQMLRTMLGVQEASVCLSCDQPIAEDATFCTACLDWSRAAGEEYEELGVGD